MIYAYSACQIGNGLILCIEQHFHFLSAILTSTTKKCQVKSVLWNTRDRRLGFYIHVFFEMFNFGTHNEICSAGFIRLLNCFIHFAQSKLQIFFFSLQFIL